jgi:phage/plasmid-like protein (TIGR03299 family)
MSHNLEIVNGKAQMAYAYRDTCDTPWHGLGVRVPADLTPEQMLEAADLDWNVYTQPVFTEINGERRDLGRQALIRDRDNKVLDVIGADWIPMQNSAAFAFFNEFIAAGDMEMDTAGSLKDGRIVWALARIKESFSLFGGKDQVDGYLHFTNPHSYGQSIDVRFTPIRVVCNNTLTLSLNTKSKSFVKVNHRREFDPEQVKLALGVASEKLAKYKEMAQFLSTKRYTNETLNEYFQRIFPVASNKAESRKKISKGHTTALGILDTQPGAELGEGTFWQAYNSVTYYMDHLSGRSQDTRLASAWYGSGKDLKVRALETAVEMAEAA